MDKVAIRFGLDIAKNIFFLHGVNVHSQTVVRKKIKRSEVLNYFAQCPVAIIGIESCGGSHYWARELSKQGHTVRLIASKFVTPYRRKGKNDANDAEAICEAISRPRMKFVAAKTESQQSILMVHRVRSQCVSNIRSLVNQMRGHLLEFGITLSQGRSRFDKEIAYVMSDENLPMLVCEMMHDMLAMYHRESDRLKELDRRVKDWTKANEVASRLTEIEGIGALTASAIVATAGDPSTFKNGRQFSAWLGLVPKQYSSGGKNKLGRITKQGDRYLRTLLIHGARTVLLMSSKGRGRHSKWIESLRARKPDNVVAVAYAAKQARMVWAIMAGKEMPAEVH